MEFTSFIPLLLGSSWASGINLYLTTASLGIAHRAGWIVLPGHMEAIAHPVVISVAVVLVLIEFVADKVPYVDSMWDSVHTFIRPIGAMSLGYMAMIDSSQVAQMSVSLVMGTLALNSHLTKATARAAINTSPEPVSNSVASVTEDVSVLGAIYLIIKQPVILVICVIGFVFFSIWFLKKSFRLLKTIFSPKKKTQ